VDGPAGNHDAPPRALRAAHILIVEDSYLILMELESILLDAGADAVWTCRSVAEALDAIAEQDVAAAILDLRLDDETSLPVARALSARGVPFFFYTGQLDIGEIRAQWPACPVISKPAERQKIVDTLASLIAPR
jgi:DNA-binding NtrC family response regulator